MKRIKGILHAMSESIHDTCYIWWLEMKNTFKDEGVLIFFILVPLGYPILYSWIYNNERVHDVPVAVVDNSHSQLSRELLRRVDASPDVRVAYYCNNLQEAHDLIGKEAANGVLYIPSDFEQKIGRGEQSHLSVYCDMSMMLTYKAIYQTAQTVATEINSEIQKPKSMSTTERDEEINTEPLVCDAVQIFNPTGGYGNFLLPGVLVLILQQTLLLGIGLSAGTARENNRYRDLVPVSRHYNGIFRIVCGKSMCYFMIYMVLACYVLLGVPRMFHLTQLLHFSNYLAFIVPFLLATIFFGMTISCVVRYRENIMLLVVFTSVPFLFLSGVSWPKEGIPGAWQTIGWLIPSTFGIRGFVRMNAMGATIQDIQVEYNALWAQVVFYMLTTCLVYNYQIRSAYRHATNQIAATQEMIRMRLNRPKATAEENVEENIEEKMEEKIEEKVEVEAESKSEDKAVEKAEDKVADNTEDKTDGKAEE